MDRAKANDGEIEKGEAIKSQVYTILREDIVNLLDFIERLKNEENQLALDIDQIEKLKLELKFMWTFVQLSYSNLDGFNVKMACETQQVEDLVHSLFYQSGDDTLVKYGMNHVVPCFLENIKSFISLHHPKSSATLNEEHLVEILDSLLVNLHDLPKCCSELIFPLMTEYKVLQDVCGNIRDFHGLKVNGCIEHEIIEYVLPQFQLVAERVGHFCFVLLADRHDEIDELYVRQINLKLAHLLLKIIPVELEVMHICSTKLKYSRLAKVELFIKQLLEASPDILREYLIHLQEHLVNNITAGTSDRNIHVMIDFLLIIFTDMPKDFIHHDKLFDLLARVGELTRIVSVFVCNLEEKSMNETNRATLNFIENIERLKEDLKHVYLKAPESSQLCFPKGDGPLFMNLLLRHLNDLLKSNAHSVDLMKKEIWLVKEDIELIRSFFGNVEQQLYKDLWASVLNVAYEAEHAINSILVRDHGLFQLIFVLPATIEKIRVIKEEIPVKIHKNNDLIVVNSPNKQGEIKSLTTGQIIVGFKEETDWIIRKLTSGPTEKDVIFIIGMPGLGKTTLAYKVYSDESVASHFDIRAWCTVDQEHNEKKLLQKVFNQVFRLNETFTEDSIDNGIADKLRKQLYGKRYLIVLDDLWDTKTCNELTRPFPEANNGSRIILTSRKMEVALQGKCHTDPLYLRLFRLEESWELLEKRIFGEESCPTELLDVGKEIAQNCKGLPLVVDLIAGVITKKEKKKTLWIEVLDNLNSFVFMNDVEVMKVIQLSYDHLPDSVKPCFLYLGSYSKDRQIEVNGLKDFWSAEGLAEQTEMKVYMDELISSSLVMATYSQGEIFYFQIHDLVHDFCLIKARKEKFFDFRSSSDSSCASDLMQCRMIIPYDQHSTIDHSKQSTSPSEKKRSSGKYLLSLKVDEYAMSHCSSYIYHLRDLRLLRVLNLGHLFLEGYFLNEIGLLVHLRYLEIRTDVKFLPFSLSNLWNLETLVVFNRGSIMVVPKIWNLAKLRHLSIYTCSFFDLENNEAISLTEDSKLESLRILREVVLSYSEDNREDIFKRFPNLEDLSCIVIESRDSSLECNWFPNLDVLNELEELEAIYRSADLSDEDCSHSCHMCSVAARHPSDFHFPSSLKTLRLVAFVMTSDSLSLIARLPNLQNLNLMRTSIQGEEWNMREDTFQNLKTLSLISVPLSEWQVGEESFPVLEQLCLWECDNLKEIPSSFGDIGSLKYIHLHKCHHLEDSALMIKKYVENMMGKDQLQVVNRSDF